MHKILIVEDEANIRELVSYNLKNNEYRVIEAEDGLQGLDVAVRKKPDLILLDIMMPGKTLDEKKGIVMTRDQLLDKVWGIDYDGENRTVDVHIRYLRRKLGDDEKDGKYIQTIRGIGYKIP